MNTNNDEIIESIDDDFDFSFESDLEEETLRKEADIKLDEYLDSILKLEMYRFYSKLSAKAFKIKIDNELKI